MEKDKRSLSIEAARLYYFSDYSQQEIAERLGVSRPTVSRLLQHAKEQGYVRISIVDPIEDLNALADRVKRNTVSTRCWFAIRRRTSIRKFRSILAGRQPTICTKR